MTAPADVVEAHLAAFAARDVDGVLATFADDATFTTVDGTVVGRRALGLLFSEALGLAAEVEIDRHATYTDGDTVVVEMTERITAAGQTVELDLACVYVVRGDELVRARVYRDLSA